MLLSTNIECILKYSNHWMLFDVRKHRFGIHSIWLRGMYGVECNPSDELSPEYKTTKLKGLHKDNHIIIIAFFGVAE